MPVHEPPEIPECYNSSISKEVIYKDSCYLHKYSDAKNIIRGICEVIVVIGSIIYLAIAAKEMTYVPKDIYIQSLALCPSRCVFLLGCILAICMVPCRLFCLAIAENNIAIFVMFTFPNYFLFFCRGFKSTGPFVTMIYRMMAADLLRFVIIYFIKIYENG